MFKLSFIVPFLFLLVSCILPGSIHAANSIDTATSARIAMQSSVSIQIWNGDWATIGSGVAVRQKSLGIQSKDHKFGILTAQHVAVASDSRYLRACHILKPDECVELDTYIGMKHGERTNGRDWAVFPVRKLPKEVKVTRMAPKNSSKIGKNVVLVGHPWGNLFVSTGSIAAHRADGGNRIPYTMVYGFAAPGSSGGGCYDEYGRLVGIVIAVTVRHDRVSGHYEAYNEVVLVVPASSVIF